MNAILWHKCSAYISLPRAIIYKAAFVITCMRAYRMSLNEGNSATSTNWRVTLDTVAYGFLPTILLCTLRWRYGVNKLNAKVQSLNHFCNWIWRNVVINWIKIINRNHKFAGGVTGKCCKNNPSGVEAGIFHDNYVNINTALSSKINAWLPQRTMNDLSHHFSVTKWQNTPICSQMILCTQVVNNISYYPSIIEP